MTSAPLDTKYSTIKDVLFSLFIARKDTTFQLKTSKNATKKTKNKWTLKLEVQFLNGRS